MAAMEILKDRGETMKRIVCWLKAIPFWLRTGVWCPHVFIICESKPAIIIATDKSFRVSENYEHNENETVYPYATLMTWKCECCGTTTTDWSDGDIPGLDV